MWVCLKTNFSNYDPDPLFPNLREIPAYLSEPLLTWKINPQKSWYGEPHDSVYSIEQNDFVLLNPLIIATDDRICIPVYASIFYSIGILRSDYRLWYAGMQVGKYKIAPNWLSIVFTVITQNGFVEKNIVKKYIDWYLKIEGKREFDLHPILFLFEEPIQEIIKQITGKEN